ncbi:MAG: hypothetical protein A2Y40_07145 [Candidatus Margulisbacteria bacterium GWF2_35_9]|nr:MAG: hypothetical protein A2Y40_07145 [Candidatus Margulisbacteria bacterium GWF2_35_9]
MNNKICSLNQTPYYEDIKQLRNIFLEQQKKSSPPYQSYFNFFEKLKDKFGISYFITSGVIHFSSLSVGTYTFLLRDKEHRTPLLETFGPIVNHTTSIFDSMIFSYSLLLTYKFSEHFGYYNSSFDKKVHVDDAAALGIAAVFAAELTPIFNNSGFSIGDISLGLYAALTFILFHKSY